MGGVASFKPFTIIIIITIILIASCIVAEDLDDDDNGGIATTSPTVSAAHSNHHGKKSEPLKPSTVVVVCVLTTVFSITFILLLYIKHCIGGNTFTLRNPTLSSSEERKNSGIDRAVVESLPVFRFGSLRGQKEGLDCAVCLTRFEDSEVLRLLPKCNHAFHVECVDTWLHAHSTCPLCRYKVDPEDVVILVDPTRHQSNDHNEPLGETETATENATTRIAKPEPDLRNLNGRISGRHSSAVVENENENENENEGEFLQNAEIASSLRRSYDSASRKIKGKRKDGMLLTQEKEHRLEHRIIVSPTIISQCGGGHQKRWSNVGPSDLLYLTSEMIISESPSSSTSTSQKQQNMRWPLLWNTRGGRRSVRGRNVDDEMEKGGMTNLRSVSETTGLGRFMRNGNRNRGRDQGEEQRHEGAVSRWFAWISNTHPS